jgi:gliding motility-associated-like protein
VNKKLRLLALLFFFTFAVYSQVPVTLYEQFNGRYDFTFVGNTLNTNFNGADPNTGIIPECSALTTSAAALTLNTGDQVQAAYLYWAGSGEGDFNVKLNGQEITAERTFSLIFTPTTGDLLPRPFFSAFADVTLQVQNTGSGTYTFSDLDLSNVINTSVPAAQNLYCKNGTSFGGWVIVVVYKNNAISFNQVNIYDGLQNIPSQVNITLTGLNIIDNIGAKTGFVAWEGDQNIATNEELRINSQLLYNNLNPSNNAFNCTNTVTGSSQLYNMDLDIYDVSNYVSIGDTSAQIKLSSLGDFVMINTVVTRLFSIAPDAVITLNGTTQQCDSRTVTVNYTITNTAEATNVLPAGTPVSVYLNGSLYATFNTQNELAIGSSENGTYTLTIPAGAPLDYEVVFVVDDNGTGTGTVDEIEEENNSYTYNGILWVSPTPATPNDITVCSLSENSGVFNFSAYTQSLKINETDVVTFYTTLQDAEDGINAIQNPASFTSAANPQTIYVRLTDAHGCYGITQFNLIAIACADVTPTIDDIYRQCNSRELHVHYTISNIGSVPLPAGSPISFYVNGVFLEYTETVGVLAPGENEQGFITLTVPVGTPIDFELTIVADDIGDGTGYVMEINEENNAFIQPASLLLSPEIVQPEDVIVCDTGLGLATFDFSAYAESLKNYDTEAVTFHHSQQEADQGINPIGNTSAFTTVENPQRIYVRLDNGTCYTTASFLLYTKKCAPVTYNYVTPNGDGYNDTFYIEGLRNVFVNFKMSIYNRYGNLIWTGNHSQADWDGIADVTKVGSENTVVPNATYYFVLELNDPDFPEPIVGWVYVTR